MFLLLFFLIRFVCGDNRLVVTNRINELNTLLTESVKYHEKISTEIPNSCNFYVGCERTLQKWDNALYPIPNLTKNNNFINLSVNYNEVITKIPFVSQYSNKKNEDICQATLMKKQWNDNVQTSSGSGILFQYYGNTNSSFTVYPAINWEDTGGVCPTNIEDIENDFNPTIRPWYITGASGQKNLVIMIDISDFGTNSTARLNLEKETAILFLQTLSVHDFVLITFYYDIIISDQTEMIRATNENINYLVEVIRNVNIIKNSRSNLYKAFEGTFEIMQKSINDGETSTCHNIIMLLSSGNDGNSIQRPIKSVNSYQSLNPKVFSYIYGNKNDGSTFHFSELSCETQANLFRISQYSDIIQSIESMGQFYGTFLNVTTPRLSEPYDDALGQGRIFTPALPSYSTNQQQLKYLTGVHGADVSIKSITRGTNFTETDITQIILESAVCEPFEIDERIKQIQSQDTCSFQNSIEKDGKLDIEKNIGWFIALSVIGFILVCFTPCISNSISECKNKDNSYKISYAGLCYYPRKHHTLNCWGFILVILMSVIISLIWMKDGVFDQAVRYHNFETTELTVESKSENPYRCCDIVDCSCENYDGPSCNQRKSNLEEGFCENGYHCCQTYCYNCNCYNSCRSTKYGTSCNTICSTCCQCTHSVSRRKCKSVCGMCYRPSVTLSFKNDNNNLVFSSISTSCSRDDRGCINKFFSGFVEVGLKQIGYVNPENHNEILTSIDYNLAILIPYIIFSILVGYIVLAFWITQSCCGNKCCTCNKSCSC
tara:strand:- start:3639 stop:5957 length:2319 start_codon:yes stop_codon:yes gene_type:complete